MADDPESFASECLKLLQSPAQAHSVASSGLRLVQERFSWEQVTRKFEELLLASR
jgi:glycosyltransferase involved in cell wall biosynthesis